MKKIIIIIVLVLSCSLSAFAQLDPFNPPNAMTMAQGGAFTAVATGYNAFYYNPAGFARKSEFTLMSMDVYGIMDRTLYEMMSDSLKQYSGSSKGLGTSSSARTFDPNSIITDAQTAALTTAATTIGGYLSSPTNSAATTAEFNALAAQPAYAAIFASSGTTMTSPPSDINELMPLLAPLLASDPALAQSFLTQLVNGVFAVTGDPPPTASVQVVNDTMQSISDNLKDQFPSGNLKAGATVGIGYLGKGFALGLFTQVDAGIYTPEGKSILSATGRVTNTITLLGGLGFNLWDGFSLGFSVRPTIIGYANISPIDIMAQVVPGLGGTQSGDMFSTIFSNGIYKGFYVGVDVGALWDVGPFTFGLVVKDLIPYQLTYSRYDNPMFYWQDLGNFKSAQAVSDSYQVPWGKINLGFSWHPDLGNLSKLIDPRISVDLHDALGFLRYSDTDIHNTLHKWNWLDLINVGAEVNLFGFMALRGGFNQGAWTAGLGLRLFVLDINTAFSARYKDGFSSLSDFSEVGFSFEIALLRLK